MYFCSDLHLNDIHVNKLGELRGVIFFERTQFKTIQEHDKYIHDVLISWAKKHSDCGLWILGDFGDTSYLHWIDEMRTYGCEVYFMFGNHDSTEDYSQFLLHFNEVYRYPTYIAKRVLLSHEPQYPAPEGVLNIAGHLHNAKLDSVQHLCVSINDINYKPIGYKTITKWLGRIPKASYKFLEEPYADKYIFFKQRSDVVMNKNGLINLPATLALKKINESKDK